MNLQNQIVNKICGCYASNMHLATMLLPYISKKIQNGEEIITILKEGIEEEMKELINKLNIITEIKEKIINIGWTSNEKIQNLKVKDNEINIIITGNPKEITERNNVLEALKNSKLKINLINVYKIEDVKNINDILKNYDFIINTAGIHEVQEIYPDYKRKEIKNAVNQ